MSKKVYLAIYVGSLVIGVAAFVVALIVGIVIEQMMTSGAVSPSIRSSFLYQGVSVLLGLGLLQFGIVMTVYPFVLLAKMWGSIQDGITTVTPGKAIGFMFIPFFNLYWIFKAWGGFAEEYNGFAARHRLNVVPVSSGVYITYAIFVLLGGIFILPIIAVPFILIPLIAKTCDAVTNIRIAAPARA
jgi:hypothetical protein